MPESASEKKSQDSQPSPVLWTNPVTMLGLLLVPLGILLLVTFWLFVIFSPEKAENQYLSIVGYLILPGVLVSGLILCPVGIALKRWRLRRFGAAWQISSRAAITFLAVTFFLMLPLLGVSGYQGYHYTESTEFCGSCHSVMDPQYIAYHQSPHARVTCAECHIGSGASPFVKSKLSGTRQLFAVALNTFPRPIPPAITQLRPSRDTCEECHWPERFYGSQLKHLVRYAPDEANTRHELEILLKVGGRNKNLNRSEGIHMHMIGRVQYVTTDSMLQQIPWVRYRNEDGTYSVFRSDKQPADAPPPAGTMRNLDCMDCHNRAGHNFMTPQESVDLALNSRQMDDSLPYIKREAVKVLAQDYQSKDVALAGIRQALETFYQAQYPAVWNNRRASVDGAVQAVQKIFQTTIFPEMKTNWRSHPNNIGHLNSAGCFRCHDGFHVNEKGQSITSDCNTCHTFLYRQPGTSNIVESKFHHELKINNLWEGFGPHKNLQCQICHNGALTANEPELTSSSCGDCHPSGRWIEMKQKGQFRETPLTEPAR